MGTVTSAIAGQLVAYRTLADGGLRITIDLPLTESQHFHQIFSEVHCEVAVARIRFATAAPTREEQILEGREPQDYGQYAKALRLSVFFGIPEVWQATGSDAQFLAFVRQQKCCARSGVPCEPKTPPCDPAHVWRGAAGFGKGLKGAYSACPLCRLHHSLQHQNGEQAIGGRAYMEKCAQDTRVAWIWSVIKDEIGVESMRDAEPAKVLAWCEKRGVDRYLPAAFKEAS